jgi:hypothetical protein
LILSDDTARQERPPPFHSSQSIRTGKARTKREAHPWRDAIRLNSMHRVHFSGKRLPSSLPSNGIDSKANNNPPNHLRTTIRLDSAIRVRNRLRRAQRTMTCQTRGGQTVVPGTFSTLRTRHSSVVSPTVGEPSHILSDRGATMKTTAAFVTSLALGWLAFSGPASAGFINGESERGRS